MRAKVLAHLKRAIKDRHHVQRAYTQAVRYYRDRDLRLYQETVALWRDYVARRRKARA